MRNRYIVCRFWQKKVKFVCVYVKNVVILRVDFVLWRNVSKNRCRVLVAVVR